MQRQSGACPPPPTHAPADIGHYENFPVASWLCPPHLRAPIAAIYHFARTADDIADEGDAPPEQRLADLATYRQDLAAAAQGNGASARWPHIFGPLAHAIAQSAARRRHWPTCSPSPKNTAYTQGGRWYASRAELLAYCARSANPVGRLLLHLYGLRPEPDAAAYAQSGRHLQRAAAHQLLARPVGRPAARALLPAVLADLRCARRAAG